MENENNVMKCFVCNKFYFNSVTIFSCKCKTILCDYCRKEFYFDINGIKQKGYSLECTENNKNYKN